MNHNNGKKNGGNQQRAQKPKNEVRKGSPFINPYTFVPISTKEPERKKREESKNKTLSGYIECSLMIHSSTFIPNTSKKFRYYDREKDHFFSEFFSYEDLSEMEDVIPEKPPVYPRIPGSEIRGMVRNVYEQLTNSCFSVIDNENIPSKRTNTPKYPGLIDLKTKLLYKAERLMMNTRNKTPHLGKKVDINLFQTGEKVFVKRSKEKYMKTDKRTQKKIPTFFMVDDIISAKGNNCPAGWEEGVVLIGESFLNKHHDSVIVKSNKVKMGISIDTGALSRLKDIISEYDKNANKQKGNNRKPYVSYAKLFQRLTTEKKGTLPVFYSEVDGIFYLSPSMITREVFSNTISTLLEKRYKHHCCDGRDGWCPACSLFGMVGRTDGAETIASRLRFTDSQVLQKAQFTTPRVLEILGEPHYSSTEFYVKKPFGASMWNYDYIKVKKDEKKTELKRYDCELRGRKVYWLGEDRLNGKRDVVETSFILENIKELERLNQLKKEKKLIDNEDKKLLNKLSNLNMRSAVRPLVEGETTFRVYFEDLIEEELKRLVFSLSLGEKEDAFHRIGKGKPFGMGAVKIRVNKIETLDYAMENGKIKMIKEQLNPTLFTLDKEDEQYRKEIQYIYEYSTKLEEKEAELVAYPCSVDNDAVYSWFSTNRNGIGKEEISQTLPLLGKDKKLFQNVSGKGK